MRRAYNALFVSVVFLVVVLLARLRPSEENADGTRSPVDVYGFPSLLHQLDAPIQDSLFRLRNRLFEQPISPEVTLVGVDDYTQNVVGKYGTGDWLPRKPFIEQVENYRRFYQPRVLAYDIVFRKVKGEGLKKQWEKEAEAAPEAEEVSYNTALLGQLATQIRELQDGKISSIESNEVLTALAQLVSEQADYNLATAFARLTQGENEDAKTTAKVLLAYYFPDGIRRPWSRKALLGDDPEDLSEDNGLEVPFLRDVGIPLRCIRNPEAYPFYEGAADLPTNMYLDYARLAYINVPRDEDGIIRRVPLVIGMQYTVPDPETGKPLTRRFFAPSISLLSCLYYWGIDILDISAGADAGDEWESPLEIVLGEYLRIKRPNGEPVVVPIDNLGRMYLDYVGRVNDFNTVPFVSVSNIDVHETETGETTVRARKDVHDRLFRKLVMIGITATGTTDVGPCPVDSNTPFVHIHMTAASNILTQTFLRPISRNGQFFVLGLLWLIVLPCSVFLRPLRLTYVTVALLAVYFAATFYTLSMHRYMLPIIGPVLFLAISYLSVILYHYLTEQQEKKRIRGMFSTMVSSDVLAYMEENPESFSLAGERREATMFFSDVAGFTTISESLAPEKLVDLLNRYLSPMTEIIMDYRGYVDKYEGDAIMAEWGVPNPDPEHAMLACHAALDQQAKLAELRPKMKQEFGVEIHVRMGVNSGAVSAGNMGSERRFSYTVMGDAVNQAARFEPANKDYGTLIMIGESTFQLAHQHIEARLLDLIVVKGKTVPIKIFELIAKRGELSEEMRQVVNLYHAGLEDMWARRWDQAQENFGKALELRPEDSPSRTMITRVEKYRENPPPDSWQGEYVRTSKD